MGKNSYLRPFLLLSILTAKANALPIYPAEVVGRDLALAGFAWFGHVGITTAQDISQVSDQIIEVMKASPVIQINPLSDFKSRTAYWGARYGIADRGERGAQILKEANFQRGLCPIYTATALADPGRGYDEEGKPTHCAVFRCDTFVNYVFSTAGYELRSPWDIILPRHVYAVFPKEHGDGSFSNLALAQNQARDRSISIDKMDIKTLDQLNPEEFFALVDLPVNKLTKEIQTKSWTFAKDPSLSSDKRVHLVDYLGLAGSADLIPQFIEEYFKTDNEELKSMLLRSTFTLQQKYSSLKDYPQEQEQLKKFYTGLVNQQLSPADSELVLRGFINLNSKEEVLAKISQTSALIQNAGQHPQVSVGLWIELSMKSKELERQSIPEVLSLLERENNPDLDDIFNQFIVRRLSKVGLNALSPQSKNQIRTYLDSVAYRYNQPRTKGLVSNLTAPFYGAWLEASALVNSNTHEEAARFISRFIQEKPLKEQNNFRSGLSN